MKKITTGGTFRFHSRLLYLANAMADQHIGLEETDGGIWSIHFNSILLATFERRSAVIQILRDTISRGSVHESRDTDVGTA